MIQGRRFHETHAAIFRLLLRWSRIRPVRHRSSHRAGNRCRGFAVPYLGLARSDRDSEASRPLVHRRAVPRPRIILARLEPRQRRLEHSATPAAAHLFDQRMVLHLRAAVAQLPRLRNHFLCRHRRRQPVAPDAGGRALRAAAFSRSTDTGHSRVDHHRDGLHDDDRALQADLVLGLENHADP